MKMPNLIKNFSRKSRFGFTLIEVLVSITITAILSTGIGTAIFQLYNVNNVDNARVEAVKQVENTIHWINRDTQMAQKVEVNDASYWIRLTWVTWEDSQKTQVVYTIESTSLIRKYYENDVLTSTMTLARNLNTSGSNTSCSYDSATDKLTLKITAEGSSGSKEAVETREIEIYPRPGI